jgi:hypothetical protein
MKSSTTGRPSSGAGVGTGWDLLEIDITMKPFLIEEIEEIEEPIEHVRG